MAEEKKKISETLEHAYPKDEPEVKPEPVDNRLSEMQAKLDEITKENAELKDKLAAVEQEKLKALAEQIAELKVTKGLLMDEGKEKEVEKLSKLSAETLNVLREELSAVKVKLSEEPAATPAEDPVVSEEDKRATEIKEMRLKMFGHAEEPYEYYLKEKDAGRL